jgi:hypothetical protein
MPERDPFEIRHLHRDARDSETRAYASQRDLYRLHRLCLNSEEIDMKQLPMSQLTLLAKLQADHGGEGVGDYSHPIACIRSVLPAKGRFARPKLRW